MGSTPPCPLYQLLPQVFALNNLEDGLQPMKRNKPFPSKFLFKVFCHLNRKVTNIGRVLEGILEIFNEMQE